MGLMWSGCALPPSTHRALQPVTAELSPKPDLVSPRDAWRLAEMYVASHPGSEVVVGSGDSMLPLYRDRTVLVVQPVATSQLRRGMTVVFIGDRGRPVAHVLIERTARGWRAIGLGNREADNTRVRYGNLIGLVVKAYAPAKPAGAPRLAATGATEGRPANDALAFASLAAIRGASGGQ